MVLASQEYDRFKAEVEMIFDVDFGYYRDYAPMYDPCYAIRYKYARAALNLRVRASGILLSPVKGGYVSVK